MDNDKTTNPTFDKVRAVIDDMRKKEAELSARKATTEGVGAFAALMLDGFASRLEQAVGDAPRPAGAPSPALEHMGYQVEVDSPGRFAFSLETPFEGASVRAEMHGNGRDWAGIVQIVNNRGTGWIASYGFRDMCRFVAKSLLRTIAIQVRRAYCHRGQKIRKRAQARAAAKRQAERSPAIRTGDGIYHTPQAALDAILQNPPLPEPTGEPTEEQTR